MAIIDAKQHLEKMFGKRGIHISESDHSMTVSIDQTDINRFELDGQLAILAKLGVYPDGSWFEELFFSDENKS